MGLVSRKVTDTEKKEEITRRRVFQVHSDRNRHAHGGRQKESGRNTENKKVARRHTEEERK